MQVVLLTRNGRTQWRTSGRDGYLLLQPVWPEITGRRKNKISE